MFIWPFLMCASVVVGPNEVSVNRADAIQPILGTSGLIKGACQYTRFLLVPSYSALSHHIASQGGIIEGRLELSEVS